MSAHPPALISATQQRSSALTLSAYQRSPSQCSSALTALTQRSPTALISASHSACSALPHSALQRSLTRPAPAAELEARTSHSLPPATPPAAALPRVPANITLLDKSHFRMTLPASDCAPTPSTVDFVRLEHDAPSPTADPFTGYYLGSFGSHGPELLLLQRGLWDGEEAVIAHKVTGAPALASLILSVMLSDCYAFQLGLVPISCVCPCSP